MSDRRPGCGSFANSGARGGLSVGGDAPADATERSRSGVLVTGQASRPGCGWRAHAGAGGRTPCMLGGSAAAGSCNPGRGVGQGTGPRAPVLAGRRTPGRWPVGGGRGPLPLWRPLWMPTPAALPASGTPLCSALGWVF